MSTIEQTSQRERKERQRIIQILIHVDGKENFIAPIFQLDVKFRFMRERASLQTLEFYIFDTFNVEC